MLGKRFCTDCFPFHVTPARLRQSWNRLRWEIDMTAQLTPPLAPPGGYAQAREALSHSRSRVGVRWSFWFVFEACDTCPMTRRSQEWNAPCSPPRLQQANWELWDTSELCFFSVSFSDFNNCIKAGCMLPRWCPAECHLPAFGCVSESQALFCPREPWRWHGDLLFLCLQ